MEVADERAVATVDSSDHDELIDVRAIEGASFDLRGAEDATQTSTNSMHFYNDVAANLSIVASFLFAGIVDKAIKFWIRLMCYLVMKRRLARLWLMTSRRLLLVLMVYQVGPN